MPWSIATQPVLDSAALEALKDQVRELSNAFDAELTRILREAVDSVQQITNRQLITADVVYTRERFPGGGQKLFLPPSPLVSVTAVKYTDTSDLQKTWASVNYQVVTNEEPGYLRPVFTSAGGYKAYPTDARSRADVVVEYKAGYGTTWSKVDPRVQRAVLLVAEQLYRPDPAMADFVRAALDQVLVGDELCAQT